MSKGNKLYSHKQSILLPKIAMEREMHLLGLEQARINLRRTIEETEIWEKLYRNDQMLKTSLGRQFTWADILDGMVDILPPRDYDGKQVYSQAELTRRFITFKAKKMKEIFGNVSPKRPNYRELYRKERHPKERNDQNFNELIDRYQQDKEDLFRKQSIFTPALPKISEEKQSTKSGQKKKASVDNVSISGSSAKSTDSFPGKERQTGSSRNGIHAQKKVLSVQTSKGTLSLAKSNIVMDEAQQQLKVAKKPYTRKESTEKFQNYPKLPAISNSTESITSETNKYI